MQSHDFKKLFLGQKTVSNASFKDLIMRINLTQI